MQAAARRRSSRSTSPPRSIIASHARSITQGRTPSARCDAGWRARQPSIANPWRAGAHRSRRREQPTGSPSCGRCMCGRGFLGKVCLDALQCGARLQQPSIFAGRGPVTGSDEDPMTIGSPETAFHHSRSSRTANAQARVVMSAAILRARRVSSEMPASTRTGATDASISGCGPARSSQAVQNPSWRLRLGSLSEPGLLRLRRVPRTLPARASAPHGRNRPSACCPRPAPRCLRRT